MSKKEGIGKVSLLGFSFDSIFYGLLLVFPKGGVLRQSMGCELGILSFFFLNRMWKGLNLCCEDFFQFVVIVLNSIFQHE